MPDYIYLPIEIKSRELDASILLACALAERGGKVYLGEKGALKPVLYRKPRGLYLGRTVTAKSKKRFLYLQDLCFTTASLDEEGLVIFSPEIYKERRIDKEAISLPDLLFAWGKENAAIWRSETEKSTHHRIHITGNPRMDLLRKPLRKVYQSQADRLKEKFGRYVLFNSNFHWVNTSVSAATRLPHPDDVASGKFPVPQFYNAELARYRIALFRAYIEALPKVAKAFPDVHFIIRPHPAEHFGPWNEAIKDRGNCSVIREGEVTPWILGSRVVLHHSCTTAVESFLLEKPVISYRPIVNDELDPYLPIALSRKAHTMDQLKEFITDALEGREDSQHSKRNNLLKEHLEATEGELACDRMAAIMIRQPLPGINVPRYCKGIIKGIKRNIKKKIKIRDNGKSAKEQFSYLFPETETAEINSRIDSYGNLLNRFENIRATKIGHMLWKIQSNV